MNATATSLRTDGAPAPPARQARSRRTLLLGLTGVFVLLLIVSATSVVLGARPVDLGVAIDAIREFQAGNGAHQVIMGRVLRLFAGLLVGAALGAAGALMQGVTRNPLADPGMLGVNGGAALSMACAISILGVTSAIGYVWFAFGGAALVAVIVYLVGSRGRGGVTPVKLALAGAAVSAMMTSATTAILLSDAATYDQFRFWTVGSLTGRRLEPVLQIAPFLLVGMIIALGLGRALNTLALGDELARAQGQRVGAVRAGVAVSAILLCGGATAIAGPIWFVGLLVPHLARQLTGPDHRWLVPYSMLLAPALLLLSDVLGRLVAPPGELQVGIVASFVGAPLLILFLRRHRLPEA